MFTVYAFGFETRIETISPLVYRLVSEAVLAAVHISIRCIFSSSTYTSLINMFLRVSFNLCLQPLVYWCGFHAAMVESEWCILL